MSQIIELIEFKLIDDLSDIPPFNDNFKTLDRTRMIQYINEHKYVIKNIEVGIAEDVNTMTMVWERPFGFKENNLKEAITRSRWGTPAMSVEFNDGDVLNFACFKEEIEKPSLFRKIFSFLYN